MTDVLVRWIESAGDINVASGTALTLVFILSGLVLIPRTVLCLAAGVFFGLPAVPIILPSTTIGGVLAFLMARYLLRQRLQHELDRRPHLRAIADGIDREGWRLVGLLRFGSPVPTTVQNYLFGLTRIELLPFTIATFFFTIPQVTLYVYLGAAGRAAVLDNQSSALSRILLGIGIVTLTTVVALVVRSSRAAFRRASESCKIG
jgi:uncharacterized membrane protein YdjX (TVP38/TMEM64 family)